MSPDQVIRAWKHADFGTGLAADSESSLPANPVGSIDIADSSLGMAGGRYANTTEFLETLGCCQGFTQGGGKCDVTLCYPYCTMGCITILLTAASICSP